MMLMMMMPMMLMGLMRIMMGDVMDTFFGPHRTCFYIVLDGLFLCVVLFGSPVAFGAVSSSKSSGPSFSCCKSAASAFFSGCNDVDLARKFLASISLAQAQFCRFFPCFLPLFPLLPFPSLAVFICFVEKCCGKLGRRFLRPGSIGGLLWQLVGVISLRPGGGKMTGGCRTAFPAPRQSEGVVLQ